MSTFAKLRRDRSSRRIHGWWRRDKPQWLLSLLDEINYWMKATSRKRHSPPFNKRKSGQERRAQRRFKSIMRNSNDEGCCQ